jgi:hypothetical protein
MSDLAQSIIVGVTAALLSTLGGLGTQFVAAKIARNNQINDKRLDALVDVRQKIEIAWGRWEGWAYVSIVHPPNEDSSERLKLAGDATHESWYATNLFELYFPSMAPMMGEFRSSILERRSLAEKQVEAQQFDPAAFKNLGPSLDELTSRGRTLLKLPKS